MGKVLAEMKKNAFRLTFNVNCSGISDKFLSMATVLARMKDKRESSPSWILLVVTVMLQVI